MMDSLPKLRDVANIAPLPKSIEGLRPVYPNLLFFLLCEIDNIVYPRGVKGNPPTGGKGKPGNRNSPSFRIHDSCFKNGGF